MSMRNYVVQFMKHVKKVMLLSKNKGLPASYPEYRISEIFQNNNGQYYVTIQLINKRIAYHALPHEILAEDKLVDKFSPRDIRTLTYLGYLEINKPKYEILARHLSQNHDQTLFTLKHKNQNSVSVTSAKDISRNSEMINNLSQEEAHRVGFICAYEQVAEESQQKVRAKQRHY